LPESLNSVKGQSPERRRGLPLQIRVPLGYNASAVSRIISQASRK
jgi:hypothetical protein